MPNVEQSLLGALVESFIKEAPEGVDQIDEHTVSEDLLAFLRRKWGNEEASDEDISEIVDRLPDDEWKEILGEFRVEYMNNLSVLATMLATLNAA